jgi:hypothetical protein
MEKGPSRATAPKVRTRENDVLSSETSEGGSGRACSADAMSRLFRKGAALEDALRVVCNSEWVEKVLEERRLTDYKVFLTISNYYRLLAASRASIIRQVSIKVADALSGLERPYTALIAEVNPT